MSKKEMEKRGKKEENETEGEGEIQKKKWGESKKHQWQHERKRSQGRDIKGIVYQAPSSEILGIKAGEFWNIYSKLLFL